MKKKMFVSSLLLASLLFVGCSNSNEVSDNQDVSWLKSSIEEVNKDVDKVRTEEAIVKYKDGKEVKNTIESIINKNPKIIKKSFISSELHGKDAQIVMYLVDKNGVYNTYYEDENGKFVMDDSDNTEMAKAEYEGSTIEKDASKYKFIGEEKLNGKDALKFEVIRKYNGIAVSAKKDGMLTDQMLNKYSDLKKAYQADLKKEKVEYYWFEKDSHKFICKEQDGTNFSIISYYTGGENSNPPVKSTVKTIISTDKVEKIVLPNSTN